MAFFEHIVLEPWHASSTYTHEAALAVGRVNPAAFWPYTLDVCTSLEWVLLADMLFVPTM